MAEITREEMVKALATLIQEIYLPAMQKAIRDELRLYMQKELARLFKTSREFTEALDCLNRYLDGQENHMATAKRISVEPRLSPRLGCEGGSNSHLVYFR